MQFEKRQRRGIGRSTRNIPRRCVPRGRRKRDYGAFACALLLAYGTTAPAFADPVLPTGGSVAAGSASISQPNASTLNVNQSTNQAIINWQTFSVGQGGTVNFNQPSSSSATLNRVLGSTPSTIAGTINAPGTVLLVNPNGIAITKTGVVNVGSFAASTLDIKNEDFLAGRYKFTGNGGSAAVTNAGRINVSDGGFAALLGGQVANSGIISARLGKVGLGAGELITLDFAGDGFLSVAVPSSQLGNLVDANGALLTNSGRIRANGGQVFLSAATAANILRDAINVPGSIRANSVGTRDGRIVLGGGVGGNVNVTGRLAVNGSRKNGTNDGTNAGSIAVTGASVAVGGKVTAAGKNGGAISVAATNDLTVSGSVQAGGRGGFGGRIDLTGANVKVLSAIIDASGTTGGGLVRIGGTFQGGNGDPSSVFYQSAVGRFGALPDIASAQTVTIDTGTTIDVSARTSGDAGTAIVWSQQTTSFTGTVLGRGGANGGNGGFVEISGKEHLAMGGSFDLRAAQGAAQGSFGTLLADPGSIRIQDGGNTYSGTDTFNDGYLNALLASANVVLDTNSASGANGATGDITLMSGTSLSWNAATTLTLNAAHDIIFQNNSNITAGGGGSVVLSADSAGSGSGRVTFQGSGTQVAVSGGGSVSAYYNPAVFGTADFDTSKVSGPLTAYMLVNTAADFLSIDSQNKNYALAKDINLGQIGGRGTFNGTFDGRMHTVSYSSVGASGNTNPALFRTIGATGVIRNFGASFTMPGSTIQLDSVGGIAAINNGTIDNSFATVNIPWPAVNLGSNGISLIDSAWVGGLVGQNFGTINNSYANGFIGGGKAAGGLVGYNDGGTITNSSAGVTVQNKSLSKNPQNGSIDLDAGYTGGLVGFNAGQIVNSFATGTTSGLGDGTGGAVGGLVGRNNGSISSSFATGFVSAAGDAGGLVGQNTGTITTSFASGNAVTSNNVTYWHREHLQQGPTTAAGGLVGWNNGSITQSFSLGTGSGGAAGALIGTNGDGGSVQTSYWNADVQAVGNGYTYSRTQIGAPPLNDGIFNGHGVQTTNANATQTINGQTVSSYAFNKAAYVGFDFTSNWYMVNGFSRPIPVGFRSSSIGYTNDTQGIRAAAGLIETMQMQLVGSNLGGSYKLISDIDLGSTGFPLWAGKGFAPIGGYSAAGNAEFSGFTGTLDGQGYAIFNLNIAASAQTGSSNGTSIVAMFQQIDAAGTVKNLGLESGSVTGNQAVAALAVTNYGTVSNVYSKLDVKGFSNVAGLVFNNQGAITSVYTSGSVDTTLNGGTNNGSTTGGIVGVNYGSITNAYSTGAIIGATASGASTGGIAGLNAGSIQNVYVTGAVTGGGSVGAIAGQNFAILVDSDFNSVPTNGQITNAYWNTDTVGAGNPTGDGLGTVTNARGMDTATMQDLANRNTNFAGFDFNNVWAPPGNGYYPELYGTSRVVWVDANNASRTYGDANPALTANFHGFHGSDQVRMVGFNLTSGATATSNVGGYAITDGGATLTGADGKTYRFIDTGTLTVTQRLLSGAAVITGIDKTYDGTTDAAGGSVTLTAGNNVVNGDVVKLSATSGTYADKNVVGVETVTINGASLDNGNYALGSLNYSGTGQITPKTLTVALAGTVRKTYDTTTDATVAQGNYTSLSGVVGTDAVTLDRTNAVGGYDNANAGTGKNVTVTGLQLTGAQAGNYTIASAVSGLVGQIDKLALSGTVLIAGIDKTYDKTAAASGGSASLTGANGVLGGDTVSVSVASGAYASVNAGLQAVTVSTVFVSNPNYAVGTLASTGSGTISPRAITVTAATDSRPYNGYTDSSATPTVTSATQIVAGDSGTFTQAFASRNVLGTNGSTLNASGSVNDGNNGNNYTVTFVDARGTITPATLTITAVSDSRNYNGTTSSSGTPQVYSGLVGTDSVSGFTQDFVSKNALGTNGSTLAVNPGSGTVSDGNNGANYTLAYRTASGTIIPATLVMTAVGDSRTYDGTTSSGLTPTIASGQIFTGDTANFAQAYLSKNVLGAGGSTLRASGSVIDGNNGANYSVQFTDVAGTITQAPLTIAAVSDSRTYNGTTSSSLTPTIASGQIFSGDTANFSQAFASKNVRGTDGSTINASGFVNDTNGGGNYAVQFTSAVGTISPLAITVTAAADSRTYNGGTDSSATPTVTSVNQIAAGDSGDFSQVFQSKNVLGAGNSTLIASGSVNDGNNGANYTIQFVNGSGTITPAALSITAVANTKAYDTTTSAAGIPTVSGLQGNTDTVTNLSETYADPNVGTGKTINVATYTINDGNNGANYAVQTFANFNGAITAAVLTYVATPVSRFTGAPNPAFTGQVSGFLGADTLTSATTGTLLFSSLANPSSPPGNYAIDGSGLSATNYVFVQAASNATALTVNQPATNPTSQFNPAVPTLPGTGITIPSPPPPGGTAPISFTPPAPPTRVATAPSTDIATAGLPQGGAPGTNNGRAYPPISQFDANQYSDFKLPDYAKDAGEAAIFTMLARGADPEHAADYMIDKSWNGSVGSWPTSGPLFDKVTFSDGAGNNAAPTDNAGFPITAGKPDFAALLANGPVMISGGGTPAQWLLATQMGADGKSIVANDPATGKQVLLSFDPATRTVGGVVGMFDAKAKGFVALADLGGTTSDAPPIPGMDALSGFQPASFLAVTVK